MTENKEIVRTFVDFQATGTGFHLAWQGVEPIVHEFARRSLTNYGVKIWTANGEWAVDDVVSQTKCRLASLGQPGAKGRFDPARTNAPGVSGLKGWLWAVTSHEAVTWVQKSGTTGDRKVFLDSDLEWNDPAGDGDTQSVIKQQPAKIERADLLPVLIELIGQLPDTLMQDAMLLQLDGLSEVATGKRLGAAGATIHRCRKKAYAILRPQLEARGIDASWLSA